MFIKYFDKFLLLFLKGTRNGRGGLGSIFVFASGNGGRVNDHCGCDGFVNMPETIAIGGVDYCGRQPFYAERCPGIMAVTYSSGSASNWKKKLATIDWFGRCTELFDQTSAATPIASGESEDLIDQLINSSIN